MKVNDFFKDYRKMVKMLPESEKIVDQYERGMITLSDAVNRIADQYINYLYNDDQEGSES